MDLKWMKNFLIDAGDVVEKINSTFVIASETTHMSYRTRSANARLWDCFAVAQNDTNNLALLITSMILPPTPNSGGER